MFFLSKRGLDRTRREREDEPGLDSFSFGEIRIPVTQRDVTWNTAPGVGTSRK